MDEMVQLPPGDRFAAVVDGRSYERWGFDETDSSSLKSPVDGGLYTHGKAREGVTTYAWLAFPVPDSAGEGDVAVRYDGERTVTWRAE